MACTAVYSLPLSVSNITGGLFGSAVMARRARSVGPSAVPSVEKSQPTRTASKDLSFSLFPTTLASVALTDWTDAPCQFLTT
jgi:hypothetical protein